MDTIQSVNDSPKYVPTQSEICELKRAFARRLASRMRSAGFDHKAMELRSVQLIQEGVLKRGINRTLIYKYLAGESLPTAPIMEVLCAVLKCEAVDLVPNVDVATTLPRGRRRVQKKHAYVACKRTRFGFEFGRVQVDVVLPFDEAQALYLVLRKRFKAAGFTLEPEGGIDDYGQAPALPVTPTQH